jgi:hypothetical protein
MRSVQKNVLDENIELLGGLNNTEMKTWCQIEPDVKVLILDGVFSCLSAEAR